MSLKDPLVTELKNESVNTRKMLERIPSDRLAYKPHEKSMTLGRLASHVADISAWVKRIMLHETFDFSVTPLARDTYADTNHILSVFDERLAEALSILQDASDNELNTPFTLRKGAHILFTLPRKVVLRNFAFNHSIHHRGQLSVYLRELNVPVPGMYGPSADEL